MAISVDNSIDRAEKLGRHWGFAGIELMATTSRAKIYRVQSDNGPLALKIYNEIGNKGEGAAVQFLSGLQPGIGPRIHKVSFTRTAVLMDWLEGPTLADLLAKGQEDLAIEHLSTIAHGLKGTSHKFGFLYRPIMKKLVHDFSRQASWVEASEGWRDFRRARDLLTYLVATTQVQRVLHGDLWWANVVATSQGPRLLDPKGVRADLAFEFCKALQPSTDCPSIDAGIAQIEWRAKRLGPAIDVHPDRLAQWTAVALAHRLFKNPNYYRDNDRKRAYLTSLLDLLGTKA